MSLDDGLDKQSYQIKDELKIRKVLEEHTDWKFEFTKHDKYDYDLQITEWDSEPAGPDDCSILGFVELERSRSDNEYSWITGDIPDGWHFYSFLERKVRDYDYTLRCWQGLKDDYNKTFYLKFNHALDNCFAAPIAVIYRDGRRTKRSDGHPRRTTLALDLDHPEVETGISECIDYIEEYLSQTAHDQETLLRFDGGTS